MYPQYQGGVSQYFPLSRLDIERNHPGSYDANLAQYEQMFDTVRVLTTHEVESIRRSVAMAPLSSDEAFRVLDAFDELLRERARIAAVLAELPASWSQVRKMLNELQALLS